MSSRPRLLILVVAYNAQTTIRSVLGRIPSRLADEYEVEILVLDDSSRDDTFQTSVSVQAKDGLAFPLHVLANPVNQGYGGNQKLGYHFAIERRFDFVALLHGDGQYAPECLPDLVAPLRAGRADAVFGSRMLTPSGARKGGMPLYKFVGNRMLTWFENRMLQTQFSEFHSGYRVYAVEALRRIPFALNTNDFHFDTEIIIQFVRAGLRILEVPIPTYYGDEICYVNGMAYAGNVTKAVLVAKAQELGVFYDRRFDVEAAEESHAHYLPKLDFDSPHQRCARLIPRNARVLDLGCAGGYLAAYLRRQQGCVVTGVDKYPLEAGVELDEFVQYDLDEGLPPVSVDRYDYILMLDVIEHLASPERFIEQLSASLGDSPSTTLVVSTANVAFFVNRWMLLLGQFNYGKRGILDRTHTRLFTFNSFRRLFEQAGFDVVSRAGVPAPWPMILGRGGAGRCAMWLHQRLSRAMSGLFSYQIFMTVRAKPSLHYLLRLTRDHSARRLAQS